MNRPILTLLTGTPTARAESALPPTAKIQLPTLVRSRIQVPMATNTQPPQHGDLDGDEAERDVGGEERLGGEEPVEAGRRWSVATVPVAALVTPRLMPRSMKNVDRVIRKLGILVLTTR